MLKTMLAFSREMFCWHTGMPVKESYLHMHKKMYVKTHVRLLFDCICNAVLIGIAYYMFLTVP